MRKNYVSCGLLALAFACISSGTYAQERKEVKQQNPISVNNNNDNTDKVKASLNKIVASYDQDKLKTLQEEFYNRYRDARNKAIAYAEKNNIPLKLNNEDGSYAELQRVLDDGTPIYYSTSNVAAAISTRANYLNSGGGLGLNLNGNGLTAHVWDGGHARASHQEYDGPGGNNRVTIIDAAAEGGLDLNFHAAHVTGTITASGFQAAAKGMAPESNVQGYKWNDDVAEATTAAAGGMLLSNHSYGYPLRNQAGQPNFPQSSGFNYYLGGYITESRDWDNLMYNAPFYLMVVAAGNDGNDNTANDNPLDGETNYDKLSGHTIAKNGMVVANGQDANINGDGSLNSVTRNGSSSEGPTDDYRIKPDIMGNGTGLYSTYESSDNAYNSITGTSMASPNVCGSLLLLQEHHNNLHGSFMRAATLKGLALHTADDVEAVGPDANTGWGLMNTKFAAETLTTAASAGNAIVRELTLNPGQTYQITVQSDGINPLLASISWTDPAGTPTTTSNDNTPVLVNDLDIRLDNGTTYMPWRLTGVTTNGSGDNIRDPYERIDINGASGQYTLTVTHKGTLTNGSQDFSLIVTGATEVAATPQVSFTSTIGNNNEGSDCTFTDINVPLNIAQAPSANADVNFTVSGGTATNGSDYQLMTNSLTFNAGSTASQNMVLRVFSDGFVEGDETVIIDFTVNANGGDASANTNADTLTFTINDDDVVPIASQTVTVLTEDFEDATGWTALDNDGDGENWGLNATAVHNFVGTHARSYSWNGSAFSPDNFLLSPQFTIPANATSVNFSYEIGGSTDPAWFAEHYSVYFTTDISSVAAITSGVVLENDRTIPAAASENRSHDLSALAGQTGYVVFRHHNVTDQWYLGLDTILIEATVSSNIQTAVNNGTTNDQLSLPGAGTVYTSDSTSGDIMLDITNNNSHDYGCVDIAVARAGTGAQPYNGSTAPNLVMDKTFYINPTNVASTGDATITFYFTEAEIAGWEAATGLSRTALTILRDDSGAVTFAPDNTINATETATPTIGAFGTHVTLTASFTGIAGGYVFGPADAFQSICFTPRVYLQGALLTSGGALMDDGIRVDGNIPTTSPYGDAVTAPASVFNVTGNDAIVDWVWVELREVGNNTNVLASTSALLQRDGDVVNYVDGTGTIKFGLAAGNYLLAINHRNHLGVMSGTLALDAACKVIDFSDGSIPTFGSNAQTTFGTPSGVSALWAGDSDGNNEVKFSGASNDSNPVRDGVVNDAGNIFGSISYTYSGYAMLDASLNGEVKFSGVSNDSNIIRDNVVNHPGNIFGSISYVILEQLP